jgi:hypothetical protein
VDTPGNLRPPEQIAREAYDRIVGLVIDKIAVDGTIIKAPAAVKSPDAPRSTGASRA